MNKLLITYDLSGKPQSAYDVLENAIKALGDCCKPLETVFIVNTQHSSETVAKHLCQHFIKEDDRIVVVRAEDVYFYTSDKNDFECMEKI